MSTYIDFRALVEEQLSANKDANLYFLLDHAGMPGLHRKLGPSVDWASLFDNTIDRNALRVAPTIVSIYQHGKLKLPLRLFEWIGEHGTYSSSVLMLASILPITTLASRLSSRLHVRLSGRMDAMLRFYDPRIFEQLRTVLSAMQSRIFFSPAEKWWHVDRAGQINVTHTQFDIEEKFSSPLELSEEQEFHLLDASEADQVLDLLRQNAPNLLLRASLGEQYGFAVRQIERAKTFGLKSTIDFAIYTSAALRYGEHFPDSPIWYEAWKSINSGFTLANTIAKMGLDD